jgi:hypothetical protein
MAVKGLDGNLELPPSAGLGGMRSREYRTN